MTNDEARTQTVQALKDVGQMTAAQTKSAVGNGVTFQQVVDALVELENGGAVVAMRDLVPTVWSLAF